MTTQDIYNQFRIPPNLQEHQLRVAALVKILTENWTGPKLNTQPMIIAGLFHDMANIIKFDLSKPDMMGEEAARIDYWVGVQKDVVEKYGSDIHRATIQICQEANLNQAAISLIASLEWVTLGTHLTEKKYPSAILIYADMRISPFGILSLKERMDNFKSRRKVENADRLVTAANTFENEITKLVGINPHQITDTDLNQLIPSLRQLVV